MGRPGNTDMATETVIEVENVVTRFGPPEVLQFRNVPSPTLGSGQVRVRVRMIGLNFADVMARLGVYPGIPDPPFIPGIEFAGSVTEVAPGVRSIRRGDRVMGFSRQGAYAEEVCVPAGFVRRIPQSMTCLLYTSPSPRD